MNIRPIMLWNIAKSGLLGFFLAGAVVFPLIEPYYLPRVVLTLGIFGVLYGINSILTLGHVTTSAMLSGHDTMHDVRIYGFILWAVIFAYYTRRDHRSRSDA